MSLCDVRCGEEGQIGKTKSWSGIPPVCLRLCPQLVSLWCRTLAESRKQPATFLIYTNLFHAVPHPSTFSLKSGFQMLMFVLCYI